MCPCRFDLELWWHSKGEKGKWKWKKNENENGVEKENNGGSEREKNVIIGIKKYNKKIENHK